MHDKSKVQLVTYISGFTHANSIHCGYHFHSYMEIVYQLGGIGTTYLDNKKKYEIKNESVIIYWPKIKHDQRMRKTGTDTCILLDISDINWLPEGRKWMALNLEHNNFLKREILSLSRIPVSRTPQQQISTNLRSTALLLDLIDVGNEQKQLNKLYRKPSHYAIKAHDYLHSNFGLDVSFDNMASEIGVSYDYLRHKFKRAYGISMKQYLMKIRIEQAKQYLEYSYLPLKQIATECGFDNARYFNTSFKKYVSITPGQYRKKYLEL